MTDLTAQLADVISQAAMEHSENWIPQAEAVLAWLHAQPCGSCHPCNNWPDETWRRADRKPPTVDAWDENLAEARRIYARNLALRMELDRVDHQLRDLAEAHTPMKCAPEEVRRLRSLLGLQSGDKICCAKNGGGDDQTEPAIACLLPATHVDEGRWHQGLGGTWSL